MTALLHRTLTLTQHIAAPPARVFALMTDPAARAQWGAPDAETAAQMEIEHADIRPGGREVARCGPAEAPEFTVTADFHVIDAPTCLLMTETIAAGGALQSVALVSQVLTAGDAGSTNLTVTLQIASLADDSLFAEVQDGWRFALAALATMATTVAA